MKKYLLLISKGIALCSFVFALFNVNSACAFIYHQPELPDKVKKLRKPAINLKKYQGLLKTVSQL